MLGGLAHWGREAGAAGSRKQHYIGFASGFIVMVMVMIVVMDDHHVGFPVICGFPFSPWAFSHLLRRLGWPGQVKRQSLVQQQFCSRVLSLVNSNNDKRRFPQMK